MAKSSADSGTHYSYSSTTKVGNIGPTSNVKVSNVSKGSNVTVGFTAAELQGLLNNFGPIPQGVSIPGGIPGNSSGIASGPIYADSPAPQPPSLFSPMILLGIGVVVLLLFRRH